jgi:hypothetical protein
MEMLMWDFFVNALRMYVKWLAILESKQANEGKTNVEDLELNRNENQFK